MSMFKNSELCFRTGFIFQQQRTTASLKITLQQTETPRSHDPRRSFLFLLVSGEQKQKTPVVPGHFLSKNQVASPNSGSANPGMVDPYTDNNRFG